MFCSFSLLTFIFIYFFFFRFLSNDVCYCSGIYPSRDAPVTSGFRCASFSDLSESLSIAEGRIEDRSLISAVRPRFLIRHFIFIIPPLLDMGKRDRSQRTKKKGKAYNTSPAFAIRYRSREHIRSAIVEVCLAQCVHNCMT